MVSIRAGLLIAFALVVLLVLGSLLTASLLGTARLARDVAGSLMSALGRDTDARLHDLSIHSGKRWSRTMQRFGAGGIAKDAETRRELLMPGLFSLPDVD